MPSPAPPRTVALVTLGCARNEVDSEELAGRLEADGWSSSTTRRTPTRCSSTPAASSSRPRRTPSTPCSRPPTSRTAADPRPSSPSAAWPSATASELAEALPEADAVLGFDDYARHRRPAALDPGRRRRTCPTRPATGALLLPLTPRRPARRQAASVARRRATATCPRGTAPASRAAHVPPPAGRRPGRAAQARLRLRPALHLLRDPVLPRRLRLPPPHRRARRGALARRAGRARAAPRQRELHVLRQGPRRPPAAGDAAARARRDRRRRAGPGVLPAAGRDAARRSSTS